VKGRRRAALLEARSTPGRLCDECNFHFGGVLWAPRGYV